MQTLCCHGRNCYFWDKETILRCSSQKLKRDRKLSKPTRNKWEEQVCPFSSKFAVFLYLVYLVQPALELLCKAKMWSAESQIPYHKAEFRRVVWWLNLITGPGGELAACFSSSNELARSLQVLRAACRQASMYKQFWSLCSRSFTFVIFTTVI